ncbi:MAG: ABC transporter permease [Opitutae bacterium]
MKKNILGIFLLLVAIFVITAIINPKFLNAYNMQNLIKWSSLYAVMSLGVAFVIITGGIDLSIGSVVGLVAVVLSICLKLEGMDPWSAIGITLVLSLFIGFLHGVLITKAKIQPFVVTLCGLLVYRSMGRWLTDNQSIGPMPLEGDAGYVNLEQIQGLDFVFSGKISIGSFNLPTPAIFLFVLCVAAAIFLRRTIWGRYLFALGNNEEGTRYSGIDTDRMKILAYVLCSLFAGIAGILFAFELDSVQPAQTGEFYELYAIAAAVLGGCSLRGGEGTVLGVVIAAAVIRLIYNSINMVGISTHLEFGILGMVILLGVIGDEFLKKTVARKQAAQKI